MTRMITSIVLFMLGSSSSVTTTTPLHPPAAVEVLVTDRTGTPVPSARVAVGGTSEREGVTDAGGHVTFRNMAAGTYKMTVGRDAFVTLQKEFTVPAGRASVSVQAALSPDPSGIELAPSAVVSKPATQTVSIPDLAKARLSGKQALQETPIGCAGATNARLVRVDQVLNERASTEVEEFLYVVSGEASLVTRGQTAIVGAGAFSIVPRGVPYTLTRQGRSPAIVLEIVGSQPCSGR